MDPEDDYHPLINTLFSSRITPVSDPPTDDDWERRQEQRSRRSTRRAHFESVGRSDDYYDSTDNEHYERAVGDDDELRSLSTMDTETFRRLRDNRRVVGNTFGKGGGGGYASSETEITRNNSRNYGRRGSGGGSACPPPMTKRLLATTSFSSSSRRRHNSKKPSPPGPHSDDEGGESGMDSGMSHVSDSSSITPVYGDLRGGLSRINGRSRNKISKGGGSKGSSSSKGSSGSTSLSSRYYLPWKYSIIFGLGLVGMVKMGVVEFKLERNQLKFLRGGDYEAGEAVVNQLGEEIQLHYNSNERNLGQQIDDMLDDKKKLDDGDDNAADAVGGDVGNVGDGYSKTPFQPTPFQSTPFQPSEGGAGDGKIVVQGGGGDNIAVPEGGGDVFAAAAAAGGGGGDQQVATLPDGRSFFQDPPPSERYIQQALEELNQQKDGTVPQELNNEQQQSQQQQQLPPQENVQQQQQQQQANSIYTQDQINLSNVGQGQQMPFPEERDNLGQLPDVQLLQEQQAQQQQQQQEMQAQQQAEQEQQLVQAHYQAQQQAQEQQQAQPANNVKDMGADANINGGQQDNRDPTGFSFAKLLQNPPPQLQQQQPPVQQQQQPPEPGQGGAGEPQQPVVQQQQSQQQQPDQEQQSQPEQLSPPPQEEQQLDSHDVQQKIPLELYAGGPGKDIDTQQANKKMNTEDAGEEGSLIKADGDASADGNVVKENSGKSAANRSERSKGNDKNAKAAEEQEQQQQPAADDGTAADANDGDAQSNPEMGMIDDILAAGEGEEAEAAAGEEDVDLPSEDPKEKKVELATSKGNKQEVERR